MDYQSQSGHVMTLANSIIGVSVLAMPFCFKQCGILLSILMLLISSIISRLACHFLLKSAILARRKTFEFLAFHIFGALGKFAIEIGIIGFLLGTCIAFFVVMGDLAPEIISEITGTGTTNTMRTSILMALALFCVLPLGLLRNVDSLNGVSKATIGFYCCLVLKIIIEALPHLFYGDWYNYVVFWRPAGLLQCLPIFSMALFCQTQLFEIYQALPNATLEKMNNLVRVAVNICTWVYIFVGMFGYIAFAQKPFAGNILLSFSPSAVTDVMKIGFVLSVAFSFPLVIFPCRASLYSLLYKEAHTVHDGMSNYIPEGKFKGLTFIIVFISLIIGIMIPNIELVLGLVGSTIGVMICVLFPVTCFICIYPKNTNERLLAQIMLVIGIIVMVLGTYKNLHTFEIQSAIGTTEKAYNNPEIQGFDKIVLNEKLPLNKHVNKPIKDVGIENVPKSETEKEVRHEPPQPEEPQEVAAIAVKQNDVKINNLGKLTLETTTKDALKVNDATHFQVKDVNLKADAKLNLQNVVAVTDKSKNKSVIVASNINNVRHNDEVDIEAIKKEETELKSQETEKVKHDGANQVLIETIKKQNEVQKEIVEQQKKLLEVIKMNVDNNEINEVNKEKLKAVKQIESIALKAIERISLNSNKNLKDLGNVDETSTKSNNDKKEEEPNNEKKKEIKIVNNVDGKIRNNSHINEIPLSYKLGLDKTIKNKTTIIDKLKMVPLPIIISNKNLETLKKQQNIKSQTTTSTVKPENSEVDKNNKINNISNEIPEKNNPEIKSMRREILMYDVN